MSKEACEREEDKSKNKTRLIVHADMDAFFASVEQRDFPEYRGRAVIVGADPKKGRGRGVVCAASYEARKFGVHSAMPIAHAYRACPHGVFVLPRYESYARASKAIMEVLESFTPILEPLSIDEAFLDCSGTESLFGKPQVLGGMIKNKIFQRVHLVCSVGIAANKFMAKIASDLEKPNGLTICPPGKEKQFLAPLPIRRLWGAGPKTGRRLESLGIHTIGDLQSASPDNIRSIFGKRSEGILALAHGIDFRPVNPVRKVKSMSEETTFAEDTDDESMINSSLFRIADKLSRRLRKKSLKGKTLTLKVRYSGFETHTHSRTYSYYVSDTESMRKYAIAEIQKIFLQKRKIRLVGIVISSLVDEAQSSAQQLDLFSEYGDEDEINRTSPETDLLLDSLKEKFGNVIHRAALLDRPEK